MFEITGRSIGSYDESALQLRESLGFGRIIKYLISKDKVSIKRGLHAARLLSSCRWLGRLPVRQVVDNAIRTHRPKAWQLQLTITITSVHVLHTLEIEQLDHGIVCS